MFAGHWPDDNPKETKLMHLLPLTELKIPDNRIRRQFDEKEIASLADSIATKGLLHPPCLRNDGITLLAGERRTRAITLLHESDRPFTCEGQLVPPGYLPCTLAGELSEIDLLEAELEENTIRQDLNWQDHSRAVAELHALRETQHGAYDKSTREGWKASDTASEILGLVASGAQVTNLVRDSQVIAEHLDDPDVAQAKTKKDALKVIQRKKEAEHNAKLAEQFDTHRTPHTILHGDTLEILPTLPDGAFDVILCDPPYGVDAQSFGDMAGAAHEYDDTPEYFTLLIHRLATESYRLTKPQAHAYIFCDIRNFPQVMLALTLAGWDVWPTPLIWDKGNVGMLPRAEHGPRRCYESIVYAIKGDKRTTGVAPDVISGIPGLSSPRFGAEKPWQLYANLLKRSVRPSDSVLDCFAGAGPIIPAANALQCVATTIELSLEKYHYQLTRTEECLTTLSGNRAAPTQSENILSEILQLG